MSKAALAALTKNAAYAVMPHRIRINGLMLGWADTPTEDVIQRAEHPASADWRAAAGASLPFGRLILPDEAARAIAWLASEESGLMTGALIDFDQSVPGAGDVSRPEPLTGEN
jgi:NAD(P)-dependent dehydrogenase (short-subunit alcohol dehydrogenase family)